MMWDTPYLTYLAEKHPFPFDGKVVFNSERHQYGIRDGNRIVTGMRSVSSLIPKEKFDPAIAEHSAKSFKRKFDAYVSRVRSMSPRKRTFRERHAEMDKNLEQMTMQFVDEEVYERIETDPHYTPDITVTADDVRVKWTEWRDNGTTLHESIEHHLNYSPWNGKNHPLVQEQVDAFMRDFTGEWVRTELRVGSLEHDVCGSMDALARINGILTILDWKYSRNVWNPVTNRPLREFRNYQFQLTAYKKLLEINGVETSDTGYLVVFHPIYETYQMIPVDLVERRAEVDAAFSQK